MERPNRSSIQFILAGIGLLIVGLLGGILIMLLVPDFSGRPSELPRVVERVELGRSEPLQLAAIPDSVASEVPMDMFMMNRMFKAVAEEVTPAVVYIQVEGGSIQDMPRDWFHKFDGEDLDERLFKDMPTQSVGSGVVISKQGYVVTNHHVVDRARTIQVTLSDKRQYRAKVIGIDPSTDLAVLKVETDEELPVVALGNSDYLKVGEWVLAIGNPFRLTSTVTAGIVSALGRQVNIIEDSFRIEDFIQTDAAINPGNSGGALINLKGELIGINTAIATESGSYEGYGFAIPVNLVDRVVSDLISYGEVKRGYLGVRIQDIDAAIARELGLDHVGGVYLNKIETGGAGDKGGLRAGDVVLSVAGRAVNASNELQSSIARHRPGDMVAVEVWRSGRVQKFQVQLLGKDDPAYQTWFSELEKEAEGIPERVMPPDHGAGVFELTGWGIGLRAVTPRELKAFGAKAGVYVVYIEKDSVAEKAGLPRDVVLVQLGDENINSLEDVAMVFDEAQSQEEMVLLRVMRRNGLVGFYEMEVPKKKK